MPKSSVATVLAGAVLCAVVLGGPCAAADLRLAIEPFPPFADVVDGRPAGAMVEAVEAICAAAHRHCVIEMLPWRRAVAEVAAGTIDGQFPLRPTPERAATFFLSPPLVLSAYAFVVPEEVRWTYGGPASVRGRTIVAYGPSATSEAAKAIAAQAGSPIQIDLSNEIMLRKLAGGGRYEGPVVGFANRDVARALIRRDHITGLRFAGDAEAIAYSVGLSRKTVSAADATAFADALRALQASGTIQAIFRASDLRPAD